LNAADMRQQQLMPTASATVGLPPRPVRMTAMSGGRPPGSAVPRASHGTASASRGSTAPGDGGAGFEQGRVGGWIRQPNAARAQPGAPLGAPVPTLEGLAARDLVL
jgi:hypothetical protein